MPDVKQVLQDEIKRLAKKEVKQSVLPLIRTIGELKRKIALLEKALNASEKKNAILTAEKVVPAAVNTEETADKKGKKNRFNGKRIIRLRKRLHLSQAELAEMVGVNMFSVSHWELGKNIPRQAQQEKLALIRSMPKKELREKLISVRAVLQQKKGGKEA